MANKPAGRLTEITALGEYQDEVREPSPALFLNSKFSILFRLNFYRRIVDPQGVSFRYSKGDQLNVYKYPSLFRVFSHVSHHRALRSNPMLRAGYHQLPLWYTAAPMSVPTTQFTAPHHPLLTLGFSTSVTPLLLCK